MDCRVSLDSANTLMCHRLVQVTCIHGSVLGTVGGGRGGRGRKGKLMPDSALLHRAGSGHTVNIAREVSIKTEVNLRATPVHGQGRLDWLGCQWRLKSRWSRTQGRTEVMQAGGTGTGRARGEGDQSDSI